MDIDGLKHILNLSGHQIPVLYCTVMYSCVLLCTVDLYYASPSQYK